MQEIRRNLLYQVKKQANKRSQPFYNPNSEDDDIRSQNQRLRTKIRCQDTEIIRLNSKIEELNQKILLCTTKYNSQIGDKQESVKSAVDGFSKVPMILENKELKDNIEIANQEIMVLNGRNNQLQAQLRQIKSDKYGLELRIKELNILEKMREQRFRDEVDRLTPIIISEPEEYTMLKDSVINLTNHIRNNAVQVLNNIFILGIKQCEGNKKLNSFTIFTNYFQQLKANKNYGYSAALSCYKSFRKVMKIIDQGYADVNLGDSGQAGTVDQWVVNSILEIRNSVAKEDQRKLFRLLALKYRCKFPIKGEKWQINEKVTQHLDDQICIEVIRILLPTPPKEKQKQENNDN